MSIQITFTNVKYLADGLWRVQLSKDEALSFAPAGIPEASNGVFLLRGAHYEPVKKTLEVPISGVEVVVTGEGGSTVLIDAEPSTDLLRQSIQKKSEKLEKGIGLPEFLDSCRSHGLPDTLIQSVSRLLRELEKKVDFELLEGEQRKWTANPNFIALTIQNRNKQLLISVKGDPSKMGELAIFPKTSRPPYCEFHFTSPEQFGDTLSVALSSADY